MSKIRSVKQFKESVDAAFELQKTRDEAKACYDYSREECKTAEADLCAFAAAHETEVFAGRDAASGWGSTDAVDYVMSNGSTIERADGGKLTDGEFLKTLPKRFIRAKLELNKARIKAEGLDADELAKLGLMRVKTLSMKLTAKSDAAKPAGDADAD